MHIAAQTAPALLYASYSSQALGLGDVPVWGSAKSEREANFDRHSIGKLVRPCLLPFAAETSLLPHRQPGTLVKMFPFAAISNGSSWTFFVCYR
jgi:hypothetical protein